MGDCIAQWLRRRCYCAYGVFKTPALCGSISERPFGVGMGLRERRGMEGGERGGTKYGKVWLC